MKRKLLGICRPANQLISWPANIDKPMFNQLTSKPAEQLTRWQADQLTIADYLGSNSWLCGEGSRKCKVNTPDPDSEKYSEIFSFYKTIFYKNILINYN